MPRFWYQKQQSLIIFIRALVSSFHLGMVRIRITGQPRDFEWLDGTNVGDTYYNFADGEPDNNQGDENCGVFYTSTGLWKSEQCTERPYVCQRGGLNHTAFFQTKSCAKQNHLFLYGSSS